ncbi:hypothetical protein BGZ49_009406 [Haplosporangium sp. Z 27]|nr:hypothetical protein BGZ49_009406 [Haplosporangium sp. Z 27]
MPKKDITRSPEQQEQDRLKRLERARRRGEGEGDSSKDSFRKQDFLDGFDQSIGLFGDSAVANGDPGKIFDYNQGLLQLHLANVNGSIVKLMSHYVWNAALVMADYIEAAQTIDIRGQRVIEFGAGAALPGLLCVKRGADFVTLTDYPDPVIVQNLERNWYENLVESAQEKEIRLKHLQEPIQTTAFRELLSSTGSQNVEERRIIEHNVKCAVRGHAWGQDVHEILDCLPLSSEGGQDVYAKYNWILLADTLWVSEGYVPVKKFLSMAREDKFGFKTRLIEIRRVPVWGETRSKEELRRESALLKEEDLENYSVEDRNRTVLVYELSR